MTKKVIVLAAVALALAPAALAANGNGNGQTLPGLNPSLFQSASNGSNPGQGSGDQSGQNGQQGQGQNGQQGQGQAQGDGPLARLREAGRMLGACLLLPDAPADKCNTLAGKVETGVANLDSKVQDRITKIQQTCTASSTDQNCQNADQRIAALQKADTWLQAFGAKLKTLFPGAVTG